MTTNVKPVPVDGFDVEQLAAFILGLDENAEYDEIDEALFNKLDCTLETFENIVSHLLPLCDIGVSPLTGKLYRGFSDRENQCWIVKMEDK